MNPSTLESPLGFSHWECNVLVTDLHRGLSVFMSVRDREETVKEANKALYVLKGSCETHIRRFLWNNSVIMMSSADTSASVLVCNLPGSSFALSDLRNRFKLLTVLTSPLCVPYADYHVHLCLPFAALSLFCHFICEQPTSFSFIPLSPTHSPSVSAQMSSPHFWSW